MPPKRKLKKNLFTVLVPSNKKQKKENEENVNEEDDKDYTIEDDEYDEDEDDEDYISDEDDEDYIDDENDENDENDEDNEIKNSNFINIIKYLGNKYLKKNADFDKEQEKKSNLNLSDEFDEETNEFNIKNGIKLNIKVDLTNIYGESNELLNEKEQKIVKNNIENIGIIIFNRVYDENKDRTLLKILKKFDKVIDKIYEKKHLLDKENNSENVIDNEKIRKIYEDITKNSLKIYKSYEKYILKYKTKKNFDLNEFIKKNYDIKIFDRRIVDSFMEKYNNLDIEVNIEDELNKMPTNKKQEYYEKLCSIIENTPDEKQFYFQVLENNNLDEESKGTILKKIKEMDESNSHDSPKLLNWLQKIKEVPFNNKKKMSISKDDTIENKKEFLSSAKKYFDNSIYGHEKVKNQLMRQVGKFIMNECDNGNILAFEGPPGIGKTELIKNGLSKALGLPCAFIPLGGLTDSSYLHGHDYTYTGSDHGKIIDILKQTKCMNPIIYFDELDKVSKSEKGDEIMSILMQLTDPTQNKTFQDKYFRGINFDFSKCLMIFSFNSTENISHILLDRMNIMRLNSLKLYEKIKIGRDFLIPRIMESANIDNFKVKISDEIFSNIINHYTFEGGVRKLKDRLTDIILELNLRKLTGDKIENQEINEEIELTKKMIDDDLLKDKHTFDYNTRHIENKIGLVNGMWATDCGTGGIGPIQCSWMPSDKILGLELTGLQGKTMKEAMSVAKTVAWKLIPDNLKNEYAEKWKNSDLYGIHIHKPDAAQPKDGPSGMCGITCAIVSLLTNIKANCEISITGEMDMTGKAKAIGGLDDKLYGVKREGIKLALYPEENQKDANQILDNYPDLVDDNFKIKSYKNIYEALNYILEYQFEWNTI